MRRAASPYAARWPIAPARASSSTIAAHFSPIMIEGAFVRRRRQRVGALDAHGAAPLGPQMHRRQGKGRERMRLDAGAQPLERAPAEHVDLQIRLLETRVAAHKRAGIDTGIR